VTTDPDGGNRAPLMLLDGKVAIVSGVGPGLGQANAHALAGQGAAVVLAARSADYLEQVQHEIEAAGGRALAVPTNLVNDDQVTALVSRTIDTFGRLDVLVNNAFRMDRGEPFESVDLTYWKKVYDVNVWGALGLTQACVPHLRKAAADGDDASIVFILSMSMRKVRLNEGAYATSKAALRTAVQALALELGPARVRVNAVAPGWIGGPNVETFIAWESENRSISPDDVRREITDRIPLGFIPPQDEIAHSVVFLASPWSKVVTGQTLDVNGGEWFA
jgi:NAD(P)-dependent dehydrogenase (short-subunit alcohol dehydrogenase family)